MQTPQYAINDRVMIRRNIVNDYLLNNIKNNHNIEVIKYVLKNKNILTVDKIEIQPMLLIRYVLSFKECLGSLFDTQVCKICSVPMITINSGDF